MTNRPAATARLSDAQLSMVLNHFAQYPNAQMVMVDMGHGYGLLTHDDTCCLTGKKLWYGQSYRPVLVATRTGGIIKGVTNSEVMRGMEFTSFGEVLGSSQWQLAVPGMAAMVENMPVGTELSILKESMESWTYTRGQKGWETFRNFTTVNQSTKQFNAFMLRTKIVAFKVKLPNGAPFSPIAASVEKAINNPIVAVQPIVATPAPITDSTLRLEKVINTKAMGQIIIRFWQDAHVTVTMQATTAGEFNTDFANVAEAHQGVAKLATGNILALIRKQLTLCGK